MEKFIQYIQKFDSILWNSKGETFYYIQFSSKKKNDFVAIVNKEIFDGLKETW